MKYEEKQVIEAFKIFSQLAAKGQGEKEDMRHYFTDDAVRGLVELFAGELSCSIIAAGDLLYLIPLALSSPFHVSNDSIKRNYLPSRALNIDIYLMYVTIIVLFGEFYDSFQSSEPTRDFLPMAEWLSSINQRILALKELDAEVLEKAEQEYEYNWKAVVEKWDAMDDLKETAKVQSRTISRLSFLYTVRRFLESQGLISDVGADELILTEKARIIIQRYYMEIEHNRGILEFMYNLEHEKRWE